MPQSQTRDLPSYTDNFMEQTGETTDTILLKEELKVALTNHDVVKQALIYKQLGDEHAKSYRFMSAVENHQNFLAAAEDLGEFEETLIANNALGCDYRHLGFMDEAMAHYFSVLKSTLMPTPENEVMVHVRTEALIEVGVITTMLGHHQEAFTCLKEALQWAESAHDTLRISRAELWLGANFTQTADYDSARHYLNKALGRYIDLNSRSGLSVSFKHLGDLSKAQNNLEEATIYYANAYNTLENTSDKLQFMRICFALGSAFVEDEKFGEASGVLFEGLAMAQEIGLPYHLEQAHLCLSDFYKAQNKEAEAQQQVLLAKHNADMLHKNRIEINLLNTYLQYEKEKNLLQIKRLETSLLNKSVEHKTMRVLVSFILVGMLIVFIIVDFIVRTKRNNFREIVDTMNMKKEMCARLAQELKTPVTIINGLVDKMMQSTNNGHSPQQLVDLEIIEKQSKNLLYLINETQMLTDWDDEIPALRVKDNIVEYASFVFKSYEDFFKSRNISLHFHCAKKEIIVEYSKANIRRITGHLLSHILRHIVENGTILVVLNENIRRRSCTFEISYPHNDLGVTNSEAGEYGTFVSIGEIMVARKIIEDAGGKLSVIKPSSDSKTVISIEIHTKTVSSTDKSGYTLFQSKLLPKKLHEDVQLIENKNKNAPSVMLANANYDMNFYLSSVLSEHFTLYLTNDGNKALQIINKNLPDLIIVDESLPVIDAHELCSMVKQNPSTAHIAFVMLTLDATEQTRIQSYKSGIEAFLRKPFNEEELIAVINHLLKDRMTLREKYSTVQTVVEGKEADVEDEENRDFMQKITDRIYRDMKKEDFSANSLANDMFISPSNLNRKIKNITGFTTTSYILLIKLKRAKKLLTNTQRPIGEIAAECGIPDFAYFSKAFKKEFGVTPSQFQRMAIGEEEKN